MCLNIRQTRSSRVLFAEKAKPTAHTILQMTFLSLRGESQAQPEEVCMPKLPQAANLEHLKAQAKALAKALRKAEPDALQRLVLTLPSLAATPERLKLADVQWLLAREYGFPSWPKLKAFVEAQGQKNNRPPSVRKQFIQAQADDLATTVNDVQALGARFALMPLRDILAVRDELEERGTLHEVVGGLIAGLSVPQARVRFDCANALDHFADERCTQPLLRLLSDPVPRVRRAALHSLSCDACKLSPLTPCEDMGEILVNIVRHDSSVRVRRTAVPLLEPFVADAEVVELLRELASVSDSVIAREAQQILRRQGHQRQQL